MDYINELNEKQYQAVTTESQYVRIIAGAGSGKTRVLTYRVAYLMENFHVAPWNILAITFTNKVAGEMKTRILSMVPNVGNELQIKTFHSFAAYFLRREIEVLGYPRSFTILDEEDQTKIVKDIASDMGFKRGDKIVGLALGYIGAQKLHEKYPEDITILRKAYEDEDTCLEIYTRYEEEKRKILALDFDDLLLKTNYILDNYPMIRSKWQNYFSQILIDEFQDTNDTEFKLIKHLLKPSTSLYVVGDPDQTIYTWRGANQNIILDMPKIFLGLEDIVLNENYRSTQVILNSANKLISNNKLRIKKDLFTRKTSGDKIITKSNFSGAVEAEYVAREILRLKETGQYRLSDIAILYRANYVSRDFETELMHKGIQYRIYGGTKFFQRREIKDILAYFRLITNVKDDVSFERIINVPRRGIGDSTTNILKEEAKNNNTSMYEYVRDVNPEDSLMPKKAINALKSVIKLIDLCREKIDENDEVFSKTLEELVYSINYYDYLQKEDDGDDRIDNVKGLFEDIRHYLKNNPEATFDEYLQNIALVSAQDEVTDGDFVTLMTAHTAKGLEFPVVFVVRFNEAVFPSQRALTESGYVALEEERRLAYVAITRAMKKLYLTYATDYSYVVGSSLTPSRFLTESGNAPVIDKPINSGAFAGGFTANRTFNNRNMFSNDGPNQSFQSDEPKRQDFSQVSNDVENWAVGDIVIHRKFGRGVVTCLEGDDIITVRFDEHGEKSMMSTSPALTKGGHEA